MTFGRCFAYTHVSEGEKIVGEAELITTRKVKFGDKVSKAMNLTAFMI